MLIYFALVLGALGDPLWAFETTPEYQAIQSKVRSLGDFQSPVPKPNDAPTLKGRGQLAVEAAKARNRAILAERNLQDKQDAEATRVDGPEENLQAWKRQVQRTQEGWKREVLETRRRWQREQEIFLGRIKEYQENTFEIPVKKTEILETPVPKERLPEAHVVKGAFDVQVRDQRARPTCSAFAGLRAVEILLAQQSKFRSLSPQYFYWASKPNCQKSPCGEKGSWVTPGLVHSKNWRDFDIPVEANCPYIEHSVKGNETQVPLPASCGTGQIKIEAFEDVRSLAEVVEKLKQNIPVIMAAKLTWNFYRNDGLVSVEESLKTPTVKLDHHSMGHAFLAVGLFELPEKVREKEGSYCVVVTNSWGKGWGSGGHACLTEKWLLRHRQPAPFSAVTKVSVR